MPEVPTAPVSTPPKLLLDVVEVAASLGCSRTYVYELISRGELRPLKLGRLTRFTASAIEEFVQRRAGEAAGCARP